MREEGPELVVFAGTGQARIIRASGVWVWGLARGGIYACERLAFERHVSQPLL